MALDIEKPSSKGQAWFCTTGLPSDIVIEVEDMTFHLHKFPLISKSRKLHELITEQENNPSRRQRSSAAEAQVQVEGEGEEDGDGDEIEEEPCEISFPEFPGGTEAFETAAKFCYGVKIDLTASNVAPLCCAGEYLEMTEEYSEDNLISKTERFLTQSVLRNIKESIKTLKSCEALMPLAENLNIPQRCIDSIASRASSTDPSLFGWPMNDGAVTARASNQILWNGIDTGKRGKNQTKNTSADPWFEDLGVLSLPIYKRLISAMKDQDLSLAIIENSLISYAKKSIPGLTRSNRKSSTTSIASEAEQRELLETIVANLPLEKSSSFSSGSSSTTRFLFGLLRTANILNASEACRATLERKIASELEKAALDDLLIPSYSYLMETLYDVDCVERILGYFLESLEERSAIGMDGDEDGEVGGTTPGINPVMLVGKLIDGYLSEIASDANLKPDKFCQLAVALPELARLFDDGLYRAVDVYLKAHPWITEEEREKICGVLDYQKLTFEACTHAAQNERLPLRSVVQVLFFEQLQLRQAIAGTLIAADIVPDSARPSVLQHQQLETAMMVPLTAAGGQEGEPWRATARENQVLKLDMDSMRSRVNELERECSSMKKAIEKIDKAGSPEGPAVRGWRKKFGCKFKTQVCDSHERTVVETGRRARHHHHSPGV
ncbi:BTB/POZ domain-containing protein At5g66560 [Macadamia integrifolia]|uniref:BTB/POZ domain-containing protein At5g66560 n=1 Tax=Macadamia integrifolia TaxID=60698 RepID=UPI001C4E4E56|nr:BTB/POZ domain-containing protein At5g66560 [Macadamia integrifolia]